MSWYLRDVSRMISGSAFSSTISNPIALIMSRRPSTDSLGSPEDSSTNPPNQLVSGVHASSHVKGVVMKRTPPTFTSPLSPPMRPRHALGEGSRHSRLPSSTQSKVPRSGDRQHASITRKVQRARCSALAGTRATMRSVSCPSSGRWYSASPVSLSVLHALTNARERSTPTTSSKRSAKANDAPPVAQPTSSARLAPPASAPTASATRMVSAAQRRGKSATEPTPGTALRRPASHTSAAEP
mmetsp:Transcript_7294/g.29706  ORF Transcript_7294/g.29706 Transcript_7294/m.29706 type:complete len:241 (+) Transcript_7294:252-974(+)